MSKYQIIERESALALESAVNGWLAKGWRVAGGASVAATMTTSDSRRETWAQAITKEEASALPAKETTPNQPTQNTQ